MFNELLTIMFIDLTYLSVNYFFNSNYSNYSNYSNISKWFFIHSIINMIVVYYSLNDVKKCIEYMPECYNIGWNNDSIKVYNYAFILHIYHCIFYKLTNEDLLHHFLMVAICGTLCYHIKSILSSLALFFLSGLPGGIDYFLLFLVKKNIVSSIFEKRVYVYISTYIRSPGCVLTFFIGLYGVHNYYINKNYYKLSLLLSTIILILWNGQYYLLKSHESYQKYLKK